MMFNKPSNWTLEDWWNSDAKEYLNGIPRGVVEWIWANDMTDKEKQSYPEYKTTGGYLRVLNEKENAQNWWDSAPEYKRETVQSLPNFDAEIFEKCTGIKI